MDVDVAQLKILDIQFAIMHVTDTVRLIGRKYGPSFNRPDKKFFFPWLFFYVQIESPNPKKTCKPHNTGPEPHQQTHQPQKPNPRHQT